MVKINGQAINAVGTTLANYLATTDFDVTRIAVECNGEIVPKSQYETLILRDNDSIEIVSFVGGG